jgi:RNA polymerase sigma-70 factor, ECF subfamily
VLASFIKGQKMLRLPFSVCHIPLSIIPSRCVVWLRFAFAKSIEQGVFPSIEGRMPSATQQGQSADSAFEAFFWQYERQIIGYLCRMTDDEQAAFDLSQETFLRAWQHFDTLLSPAQSRAWLFRVATNLALNYVQRRSSRPMIVLTDQEAVKSDPGHRFIQQEFVRQTLQQLPPKQRSALLLFEVYGHSCEEIGALLHMSSGAVKMTLRRAREHFRSAYLREEGDE